MQRRKFLATVGSLAAGSAAAIGTGAFESASATRNVTVEVEEDASAWIALNPLSDYASYNEDGLLELNFGEYPGNVWAAESQGMNGEATFEFADVFEVWADLGSSAGQYYFWIEPKDFDVDVELTAGGGQSGHAVPPEGIDLTQPFQFPGQPGSVFVDMTITTAEPIENAGGTLIIHASKTNPQNNA
ncbi:DUF1102 family protein [Halanaeroarchaeum sp. HSR-CO]|uniref:hypothetical protein n=1 Tax=Halanaeroarchaeum sp. HSR-CO TaxID=2866382 RepID=UPI00217F0047|nr:hypothetical protein [Halanaeroarchaeum sp. HSR-CO]UWG46456.1 DUF1102 family protein [Halanaeroarchaeum sp. HSR-CO]